VAAGLTAGLVAVAGVLGAGGQPPSAVVLATAIAFLPYGALVAFEPALDARGAVRLGLVLAAGAGLVLLLSPPVLSDDVYRYLWDGRVLGSGIDPYRYPPDHPALAHLRDAWWARVNNPEIATIYPPLAQGIFAAADAVWHDPRSLQAVALAAHLGTVPLVARLAGGHGPRAALLWALNPLALVESAMNGHVDAVCALAVAACLAALVAGRSWLAATLVGVASALKLVGIALAPLIALRSRRAAVLAVGLALLPLAPLALAGGGGDEAGLTQYSRRWRGNEGLFAVVEAASRVVVDSVGDAQEGEHASHQIELPLSEPVLASLEGTFLDPRATLEGEKKVPPSPAVVERAFVASVLARGLVLLGLLALAVVLVRRDTEPILAARWVLIVGLLFAPQVHPWYLLWLLPLEIAAGRVAGLVWSAVVLVAYAPLDQWLVAREWVESPLARLFEYGLVVGVLTAEARWIRKNPSPAPVHVG